MMSKEMLAELRKLVEDAEMLGCTLLLEQRANLVEYTAKGKVKATYLYDYTDPGCVTQINSQLHQISDRLRKEWEPEFQRVAPALQLLNWTLNCGYTGAEVTDEDGEIAFYPYCGDGVQGLNEDISDYLLDLHADKSEAHDPQNNQGPYTIPAPQITGYTYSNKESKAPDKNQAPNGQNPQKESEETKQPEEKLDQEVCFCLAIGMHIIDLDQLLTASKQAHCTGKHGDKCQGCGNQHCQQDPQLIESLWRNLSPEAQQKLMASLSPERQEAIKQCLNRK